MAPALRRRLGRARRRLGAMVGQRRFSSSIRPTDRFIAAYPKSGTNWVRFLVASVMAGEEIPTFGDSLRYVPDINREYFARLPLTDYEGLRDPRAFNVHAPYDPNLPRVVYVVRDPRDVMVSYYHHHRREDPSFDRSIETFVSENRMFPGDWGSHVAGWRAHAGSGTVLVVRYEDLQSDTHAGFRRVVDFLGFSATEEELDLAIRRSSFEHMRRIEEAHGLTEGQPSSPEERFMRRGQAGSWREELPRAAAELVERRYAALMTELGYR